ncbi:MAG: LysM peptidoglycan-binding domain-containing protein [Chitinophagales bacterium]
MNKILIRPDVTRFIQKYFYGVKLTVLIMRIYVIVFLLLPCTVLHAQTASFQTSPESSDSHLVVQGETLYSLSKRYETTVAELLRLNPEISNYNLTLGKILRVPLHINKPGNLRGQEGVKIDKPIMYKVEKGETVFSISKKFSSDVNTVLMWNDLSEPAIREGQVLIVGYEVPDMKVIGPLAPEEKNQGGNSQENQELSSVPPAEGESAKEPIGNDHLTIHHEKGIAKWSYSGYDDGNFYALHATALPGTEITIRNMMNSKTLNVKVIGRLPATPENEKVLIRISESAAKKLNVLDEKFLAEITYYDAMAAKKVEPN